jgi:hypothetical protein
MGEILQTTIPYNVSSSRALPGVQPLDPRHWILVDEAFGAQMACRADLLRDHRETVVYLEDRAKPAASELLTLVLQTMGDNADLGFQVDSDTALRPDGMRIPIDRADPLGTLGHLVQEDFCLLQKSGNEHVLSGALLCFPAGWRLAEKAGRPLTGIHTPVQSYDDAIAQRVQRLFDGVRAGKPLWRFNALWYKDPQLHQPYKRSIADNEVRGPHNCDYFRSERQCILRLPETGAVVFSIHTFVVAANTRIRPA